MFGPAFAPLKTDGSGNLRPQQLQALALLEQAGWHADGDRLVNAQGEPLAFTFLNAQNGVERLLLPWKRTLKQIGIDLQIRRIDPSQYVESADGARLRHDRQRLPDERVTGP
ncbi:ABC transporter substrate-binding protein [Pseudomonas sp. KNUC1026]|uniref:ABC transporter substrate-binding protein n=1 Tax=Pseudomonas sp. KNUC1026 TaxID=2893890 RepID=UPI0022A7AD74|nr:ABC transporter substrate-binding protein [Pseudomonas sp. KNUC1026]